MGVLGRWSIIVGMFLVATGCSSETPQSTDHARIESLTLLAADIEAEPECVLDTFDGVAAEDLEQVGIRDTGTSPDMWDGVIADAASPVLDPLMLTVSRCTDFFEQLVYEDLSDLLEPGELDCIVEAGRINPDIVVLHMAGTRDGAALEDTYSEAMVVKIQRGHEARSELVAEMRAIGRCSLADPLPEA